MAASGGTLPPGWSPFVASAVSRPRSRGPVDVIVFGSGALRACYG